MRVWQRDSRRARAKNQQPEEAARRVKGGEKPLSEELSTCREDSAGAAAESRPSYAAAHQILMPVAFSTRVRMCLP